MTKSANPVIRTSSDLPDDHWMARQLPPNTSLRGYAEDRAVSMLASVAIQAIEEAGLTRAEVARLLGTTRGYVSQVLNGSTNMTLKTFGALLWAAGRQVASVSTEPVGSVVKPAPATVFYFSDVSAAAREGSVLRVTDRMDFLQDVLGSHVQ
jgi:transcriptional regulator with XRE-family HTH domain